MKLATIRSAFSCYSAWWRMMQDNEVTKLLMYSCFHLCLAFLSVSPPRGQTAQLAVPHSCGRAHSQLITGTLLYVQSAGSLHSYCEGWANWASEFPSLSAQRLLVIGVSCAGMYHPLSVESSITQPNHKVKHFISIISKGIQHQAQKAFWQQYISIITDIEDNRFSACFFCSSSLQQSVLKTFPAKVKLLLDVE